MTIVDPTLSNSQKRTMMAVAIAGGSVVSVKRGGSFRVLKVRTTVGLLEVQHPSLGHWIIVHPDDEITIS